MIEAVVYESNSGFTKRYAEMIGEKTGLPVYHIIDSALYVSKGAPVFFIGWVMAGKIEGYKIASKRYDVQAAAAVGVTPKSKEYVKKLIYDNKVMDIPLFYLMGGISPDKLSKMHKKILNMIADSIERKAGVTKQELDAADCLRYGCDFVSEDNLSEILEWFEENKDEV